MINRKTVCAFVLLAAVVAICIAPAYSVEPTALRAWTAAGLLLAALTTLITFATDTAPACDAARILRDVQHPRARAGDLLRFTCTLLI